MGKLTQDYVGPLTIRSAAILTNGYVAGSVIGPGQTLDYKTETMKQLIILADFTIGSLTDCQIKVEFSPDNSTYYQESVGTNSSGTVTENLEVHKLTATGKYRIAIPILDRYIKISAIGTGTVTSSSLAIVAIIGVN